MTHDKLEKTCVACYALFTDWVFPKITIFEYENSFCFKDVIGILSPFKN
jgi:hypothetical protein